MVCAIWDINETSIYNIKNQQRIIYIYINFPKSLNCMYEMNYISLDDKRTRKHHMWEICIH